MKILVAPPDSEDRVANADFVELLALQAADGNVSQEDLSRRICRPGEEDDQRYEEIAESAFQELAVRQQHMGAGRRHYPFDLDQDLLTVSPGRSRGRNGLLYVFLLLATRMDMKRERRLNTEACARLDATELFEKVSLEVAMRYWGGNADERSSGVVLGTSRIRWSNVSRTTPGLGRFGAAVDDLCRQWGEGGRFRNQGSDPVTAKDDGVDIVVWRGFSDRRQGTLAGFGQCKTGSSWSANPRPLAPEAFCKRWLETMPAVDPVSLYFVANRIVDQWYNCVTDLGILFDRCRILDYADGVSQESLEMCAAWTSAAMKKYGLRW